MQNQNFPLTTAVLSRFRTKIDEVRTLLSTQRPKPTLPGEVRLSRSQKHVFVGYNDIDPVCGTRVLSHAWGGELRRPGLGDSLDLGYFDTTTKEFHRIATTTTWCWQMGARLRWAFGGLAFNSIDANNRAVLMAGDVHGGPPEVVAPLAMMDVSPDQKLGLAISFAALHKHRPGYGYALSSSAAQQESSAVGRGLVVWNFEEQRAHSLITETDIQRLAKSTYTYLNHASFGSTAEQFLVFVVEDHATGRKPKLLLGEAGSDGRRIIVNELSMVSHFAWFANDTIIVWGRSNKGEPAWFAVHSVPGDAGYEIERLPIRNVEDAHASVINDDHVLLDRYPDSNRMQTVEMVNIRTSQTRKLLHSYLPPDFRKDLRCDLHARVSNAGFYVIDDVADRKRVIRVLPLNRSADVPNLRRLDASCPPATE